MDALSSTWPTHLCLYAFPPICILERVLTRIFKTEYDFFGYLLFPVWNKQPFWSILCPDGMHFRSEVVGWQYVPRKFIVDGDGPSPFFTYKPDQWFQSKNGTHQFMGHVNMFIMIAIDRRLDSTPRSQSRRRAPRPVGRTGRPADRMRRLDSDSPNIQLRLPTPDPYTLPFSLYIT